MSPHLFLIVGRRQCGLLTRVQFRGTAEHAGRLRCPSLLGHFRGRHRRGGVCFGTACVVCMLIFQHQRGGGADGVGVRRSLLSAEETVR